MVQINMLNEAMLIQIAVLVIAVLLTFVSLRARGFMWFITCFAWVAVIALWVNDWVQGIGTLMAVLCLGLFITSFGKGR